ncbi:hypothetical protein [Microvirus D_HF38_35]|nr:hypothetical protein [Microvirus D_HF38_35]
MKRFAAIVPFGAMKVVDYEQSYITDFGESVTDDRYFTPREVQPLVAASTPSPALYDFPDGKDNGVSLPISRKKGVDLAEVSLEVGRLNKIVEDDLASALELKKAKDRVAALRDQVDNQKDSQPVLGSDSGNK